MLEQFGQDAKEGDESQGTVCVLLDACRTENGLSKPGANDVPTWSEIRTRINIIHSFSSASGARSFEGSSGNANSLYTAALLKEIRNSRLAGAPAPTLPVHDFQCWLRGPDIGLLLRCVHDNPDLFQECQRPWTNESVVTRGSIPLMATGAALAVGTTRVAIDQVVAPLRKAFLDVPAVCVLFLFLPRQRTLSTPSRTYTANHGLPVYLLSVCCLQVKDKIARALQDPLVVEEIPTNSKPLDEVVKMEASSGNGQTVKDVLKCFMFPECASNQLVLVGDAGSGKTCSVQQMGAHVLDTALDTLRRPSSRLLRVRPTILWIPVFIPLKLHSVKDLAGLLSTVLCNHGLSEDVVGALRSQVLGAQWFSVGILALCDGFDEIQGVQAGEMYRIADFSSLLCGPGWDRAFVKLVITTRDVLKSREEEDAVFGPHIRRCILPLTTAQVCCLWCRHFGARVAVIIVPFTLFATAACR